MEIDACRKTWPSSRRILCCTIAETDEGSVVEVSRKAVNSGLACIGESLPSGECEPGGTRVDWEPADIRWGDCGIGSGGGAVPPSITSWVLNPVGALLKTLGRGKFSSSVVFSGLKGCGTILACRVGEVSPCVVCARCASPGLEPPSSLEVVYTFGGEAAALKTEVDSRAAGLPSDCDLRSLARILETSTAGISASSPPSPIISGGVRTKLTLRSFLLFALPFALCSIECWL